MAPQKEMRGQGQETMEVSSTLRSKASYTFGGCLRRSFRAHSHKRLGSRIPSFANAMIFLAMVSFEGWVRFPTHRAASAISKATFMTRMVSGSTLKPSKYR
jgi:hypothetical protein